MTVRSFTSLDEMYEHMAQQTALANAALSPEQRSITYGSYVVGVDHDIIYFGYVHTLGEVESGERKAGADTDEVKSVLESTEASHTDGLMFGRYYSVVEPDGELGSNHRMHLWPITEELFGYMRSVGWSPNTITDQAQHRALALAANALMLHRHASGF